MITLALGFSIFAAVFATLALVVALNAKDEAENVAQAHGFTLDAADELFEDHEARINDLELQLAPAQQFQQETGNG